MQHLRLLASEIGCKPADQGSTLWAFELVDELIDGIPTRHYRAKFPQPCSAETTYALSLIIEKLEEHEDVQRVTTNATTETAD
jgi:transcriptional/translational regulatory protein YebC/TACO1